MPLLDDFFREVDANWGLPSPEKVTLRIIGSSALMLQTSYERGTKDSDVFETAQLTADTKEHLLALAGSESVLAKKYRLYVEVVPNGFPFLPHRPLWHRASLLSDTMRRIELEVLDVVDVVVSKLKRFNADDRSDIDAMVQCGLVPHPTLIDRVKDALDCFSHDARAGELPRYVKNLHTIERDFLGVEETTIELPEWVDR